MKQLLLLVTILFVALGGYFVWQTTLITIPVESYLSEKAYIRYYIDTAKFDFTYIPAAKRFEIARSDGKKVDVDLTDYDESQLETFFATWIATSTSDRAVSYVPNLEVCKYLAISLRYTEIGQMKLADFMRCHADLTTKDNVVPI